MSWLEVAVWTLALAGMGVILGLFAGVYIAKHYLREPWEG